MGCPRRRNNCSYLILPTALVILAGLVLAPPALGQLAGADGAAVTVDYAFEQPAVVEVTLGGDQYQRVMMPGCPNDGAIGHPALPACGAQILLPLGADISSIEIVPSQRVLIGTGYTIEPVGRPVKLSDGPDAASPPVPDPDVYGSAGAFPSTRYEQVGTFGFRGYQILTLKLQPVEYVPSSGTLYYYPQLTVVVNTVDTGKVSDLFRGLPKDAAAVVRKVDNPEMADTYRRPGTLGGRGFELLIITTPALSNSFQPLKAYHDANGIMTEIHTTTDVGSTDPDDIRDHITTAYQSDGVEYVIIGADDDIIPAKNLYVEAWSGGDVETAMPGDLYFGCLDGTWNYDGDSRWGEPTDGDGGGDVDLVAEVYVGRAAVGNTTEADRFVNKTLWYLNGGHTRPEKVLMVGEHLGFGGDSEYAGNMMDQIIDGSSADGYTTVGIPSDVYDIDKLYERDGSWSQSDLVALINAGLHVINHLGHGSPNYAMKLYDSDIIADLTNTDLCFVYSQTCLAGHFDGTDCWAEYMNIKTDNGGFGVVMNARYGWGTSYSTDGPSQRFDREFWDAVFGEGLQQIGRANQDSKEDNIYRISGSCMRWCTYELNVFGDPTVRIQGVDVPLGISFPAGLPTVLTPGEPTDITVEIDPGDEAYVSGTGTLYYRYDGGTYLTSPLTHVSGYLYQATLPPAGCDDTPEFYFSAEGTVSGVVYSPEGAPASTYTADVGEVTVIFDDNFETDQGWTAVNLGATSGDWQRGIPVNDPDWDYDPASDSDGSGRCYLTQNEMGNTDVDDGAVRLTSPIIDMSGGNITISYDYYLYLTNSDGSDMLLVEINNDGGAGSWTEIARHDINGNLSWRSHTITQADLDAASVTLTSTMQMRFTANDADTQSINESGLDAFLVTGTSCESPEEYTLTINIVGSGLVTKDPDQTTYVDGTDVELTAEADSGWSFDRWEGDLTGSTNPDTITMDGDKTVTAVFVTGYALGDMNCDGAVNGFDIDPFVMVVGGDLTGYYGLYPDCDHMLGDINDDGSVDGFDIDPFVVLIGG